MELETKICRICDMELPLSMFSLHKSHGRRIPRYACKDCMRVVNTNNSNRRYRESPVFRAKQSIRSRNNYHGKSHMTAMELAEIEERL